MNALTPGLYRATVRGIPGESIVKVHASGLMSCLGPNGEARVCYVVTDARPLIVLDIATWFPHRAAAILTDLDKMSLDAGSRDFLYDVLTQIEAQQKPARIPEPGWDGKVLAHTEGNPERREFIRFGVQPKSSYFNWHEGTCSPARQWDDLIDPTLIRGGVTS